MDNVVSTSSRTSTFGGKSNHRTFVISPEIAIAIALVLLPSIYYLVKLSIRPKAVYRPIPANPPNISPTTIVDLRIYPVKSCRGLSVDSRNMLRTGLELDRQWMFVCWETNKTARWKFITIRGDPRMTMIKTAIDFDKDELVLTVDGPSVRVAVPAHPTKEWLAANTEDTEAEIWDKNTAAHIYPAEVTAGISKFLEKDVRLVYKGSFVAPRLLRGNGSPSLLGRQENLGFADMMPVLVASLASMAELNERIRKTGQVDADWSIHRFRPNIIVQGNTPWEEDNWKMLKIAERNDKEELAKIRARSPTASGPPFILDVASRCMRCQVPNVDPLTAEKHKQQPWDTLMKYRRIDKGAKFKPAFGMLCCPRNEGEIRVGMELQVLETADDHLFQNPMH